MEAAAVAAAFGSSMKDASCGHRSEPSLGRAQPEREFDHHHHRTVVVGRASVEGGGG